MQTRRRLQDHWHALCLVSVKDRLEEENLLWDCNTTMSMTFFSKLSPLMKFWEYSQERTRLERKMFSMFSSGSDGLKAMHTATLIIWQSTARIEPVLSRPIPSICELSKDFNALFLHYAHCLYCSHKRLWHLCKLHHVYFAYNCFCDILVTAVPIPASMLLLIYINIHAITINASDVDLARTTFSLHW